MTTTLKISEPRELLAYLPHHLGFQPHNSLVIVCVRGTGREVGLVLRVDIADIAHPDAGAYQIDHIIEHIGFDGASEIFLALYCTEHDLENSQSQARIAYTMFTALTSNRINVLDAWAVTDQYFYSLTSDENCCVEPQLVTYFAGAATAAAAVYADSHVATSREELANIALAPKSQRDRAQRATHRWVARRNSQGERSWQIDSWQEWEETLRAVMNTATVNEASSAQSLSFNEGIDEILNDPLLLGRLQAGLEDYRVRDAVMISAIPGEGDLPTRSVLQDAREEVGRSVDKILDPTSAVGPGFETHVVERVLKAVAAHSSQRRMAPVLTLMGWISWWQGAGARAAVLIERALDTDPTHIMARLVARVLDLGIPPGWVAQQRRRGEVG